MSKKKELIETPSLPSEEESGFKETSIEDETVSNDAVLTERERSLRDEIMRLQNEQGSVIQKLQRQLSDVMKKTGTRVKEEAGTEEDGIARVGTDFSGKIIKSWNMKQGTGVYMTPEGRVIDTQTVQFENMEGEKGELEYRAFHKMISANKLPCRIKGYLRRDEKGFFRPTVKYKPDDLVLVSIGRFDGDPEDGIMVYDGPEVKIGYRFLNP